MSTQPAGHFAASVVAACETYTRAVEASLAFSRAMWRLAFETGWEAPPTRSPVCLLPEASVREAMMTAFEPYTGDPAWLTSAVLARVATERRAGDGTIRIPFSALLPLHAARQLVGDVRPESDLRFFVARGIRRHYNCVLSARAADLFHRLSAAFNKLAIGEASGPRLRFFDYRTELAPKLEAALSQAPGGEEGAAQRLSFFVECCRMVDYLQPSYNPGKVNLRARHVDPEFLISRLFGLPSGIEGFDALFGGGGLMLVDDIAPNEPAQIRGRTVLVLGRYATGKSVLALEMAVAVATKGGVAWVMPLEQTAEECLFTLRSMCRLPLDGSVVVATDAVSARACLQKYRPDRGAIILLRTIKESFEHFRGSFEDNVAAMKEYPIKLIVVDPINAIHREHDSQETAARGQMLRMFEAAKNSGTNVWLIAEEGSEPGGQSIYEQNITDTVIHLSLKDAYGDVQRYLEVTKSRLQREQRGKHPYNIVTDRGLVVYPSASSVAERLASRRTRPPDEAADFGFKPLNDILGADGLRAGDVIVLDGPAGSLKSQLGLLFLLHLNPKKPRPTDEILSPGSRMSRSFLIAARDDETSVQSLIDQQPVLRQYAAFQSRGELRVGSLRGGFVHPGYILQHIEREFFEARAAYVTPERIMIDDVAHWETGCPYVREDQTFGDTLVDMLRRHAVTSLLVCSRAAGRKDSSLQQAIIDRADCVIQFERIQFRGTDRIVLRVIKTRGMRHRRETFELVLNGNLLELKPTSSLLRILEGGTVETVGIRLFLHAESSMQTEYNEALLATVRSVLSPNAQAAPQQRVYMDDALALASNSSIDELQLLQLDEFQVPKPGPDGRSILRQFPTSDLSDDRRNEYLERLAHHRQRDTLSVLPLYVNVSLLAYRRDLLRKPAIVQSWKALADECRAWERRHPDSSELFFDFPGGPGENYNCLFLEILLSLSQPVRTRGLFSLRDWLGTPKAREAAKLLRTLCRRSHQAHARGHLSRLGAVPTRMNPGAVVWRTWYSTLNHLMSELSAETRLNIELAALPKNVAIAGEWYIGIPVHSAAPDVGLKLMEFLTSREAELDRMKLGVGLPTRASFYRSTHPSVRSRISPYFAMNMETLAQIVQHAFARSSFDGYSQVSGIMSSHLQTMIEVEDDATADSDIALIFTSLAEKMGFMQPDRAGAGAAPA